MFNKVCRGFGVVATRFYYNNVILSGVYKCTILQLRLSIRIHGLTPRGYCSTNPSSLVSRKYDEMYEHELNEFLRDPNNKAMYDKLKLQLEHMKNHRLKMPRKELTAHNWLHLLKTANANQRRSYLEFLWKIEMKDQNRETKKAFQRRIYEAMPRVDDNSPYGLQKYSMFYRIRDSTIAHFYNSRLINAMLHEPSVVLDLGYEGFMTPFEQHNCAKQLLFAFSENRSHANPFNLHFCNTNSEGPIMRRLHKLIPNMFDIDFPLNISSQSYLDLFDRKQLVYLTPHTNDIMENFDPKLIYVIGAMVDKMQPKPLSFQKARKEGLRMMRFPLSEKLQWGTGSTKNLPLNHVIQILLDLRHTNNWMEAFKNIPRRKLKEARMQRMMKQIVDRQNQISRFT